MSLGNQKVEGSEMKKKIKLENVKMAKGKTDWSYLKEKDSEVFDINSRPLNEAELSQMKKVKKLNK